ncbi:diguanylate cyclase [Pseudomonas sp. 10B238]|uniref:response regulator n=1 Tax=Pseudomonadaceae TaxID=135621 RepID=UPI000535A5C4|nr:MULTISPECIES: response regulator [Pseudomonadaceae]AZZ46431.1 response regulator [Pseudomonadaceae bacterium SI-3]KJJ63582.1 diguanylate cyclase [Pseudomonas sp. 10B238]MCQ4285235.1 response regulator [Stutzerimonas stutzeri]BAP78585.1 response regulator receiver modulated diguanylate cyclase [Pseudomonas sp. MT-1]
MPNPQLSILVVDDAKFSSVMIGRALSKAGYEDIRFANSASAALELIEQRPANVLLADWLMPEMDGLELTAQVRQQDEMSDHYTYIILLTGRDGQDVLSKAFDHGVDDFIGKSVMNDQLVPRVFAADRLCGSLQRLMRENRLLTENIASLEKRNLIDPITGLGNSRYLHQRLGDSLRQIESRGGALCFLLIGLPEVPSQRERYGEQFHQDLLRGIARRLQQLVRPLDVLTRLDDRHFGVLTLIEDLRACAPSSFKRLHEGLNLKAFKTDEGFISIKAGIAMISLDASALPVDPKRVIAEAGSLLPDAYATGRIVPMRYKQPA